jgi:ABC-2 type transport system ATP-binding protein
MQQKIQFIITVVHKPKLLIFDEPFSGFDPINTKLLKNEILNLKEEGATIIFSTHNMASVEEVCDHIALIDRSKKLLDGNIDDIREQYKNDVFEIETTAAHDVTAEFSRNGFQLIDYSLKGKVQTIKFQVEGDASTSIILPKLMQKMEIRSFREVIPSMNEVFIRVVEQANPKN